VLDGNIQESVSDLQAHTGMMGIGEAIMGMGL